MDRLKKANPVPLRAAPIGRPPDHSAGGSRAPSCAQAFQSQDNQNKQARPDRPGLDVGNSILKSRLLLGSSFFLWLDVGDGEAAALRLWREAGIRVLPGAYMGHETEPGNRRSNPGFRYIRVALVHELSTIEATLGRLADLVGEPVREVA